MKSVIFLALFISISSTYGSDNDCILIHLNNSNMLEPFFGTLIPNSAENCENVIKKNKEIFNRDLMTSLKAEDDQNCILGKFDDFKIHDLYLKGRIYYDYKKTAISNFTNEVSLTTSDLMTIIKGICTARNKFGAEFDSSIQTRETLKDRTANGPFQECMKKYFFEKQILNAEEFNVDVSKINAVDCEEIIDELESPTVLDTDPSALFYGLPSLKSQKCIHENIEREKIVLKMSSFGVALFMELNDELIRKLRERYIDVSTNNLTFMLKCLEEILYVK